MINNLSLYASILGSVIVFFGLLFSGLIFKSYLNSRNNQTLALAITVFGASSGWLTDLINLLVYFSSGNFIDNSLYAYISFAFVTLVFPSIMFISISILKAEQVKIWFSFSLILMVIMYLEVFILLPINILAPSDIVQITYPITNGFPENTYMGYAFFYIMLTIISGLLFGILIFRVGFKSEIQLIKVRGLLLGTGLISFTIFGMIDGLFATDLINSFFIILVVTRIFVILALYIMYTGIVTPSFIMKRFNSTKSL